MLLRHRIHEWFADRLSWVQYPNIRADMQRRAAAPVGLRWERRVGLGVVGGFGLVVSTLVLAFALFVLWAIVAA